MPIDLPPKPSREALIELCREEPEKAADLILMIWGKVEELVAKVEAQEAEIASLKAKLSKNSSNSSLPPSSDRHRPGGAPPKKGKGGRRRKPGGQGGHKGRTLERSTTPDRVIELDRPARCRGCGGSLARVRPTGHRGRQVFDIPEEVRVEVTEYRAPLCSCPRCGQENAGEFPPEAKAPVGYGARVRALAVYLHTAHLVPYERLGELLGDLYGCGVSTGALAGFVKAAGQRAGPLHERIREEVRSSDFMHNDETGLSLLSKTGWLHVACDRENVYLKVTPGRGFEDIRSVGVFEGYAGRSVHDFLSAYHKFDIEHSLCNAHLLRDLTYVEEQMGQGWAKDIKALLLEAKRLKDREYDGGRKVGDATLGRIEDRYREIVRRGYRKNPEPERKPGQRGRVARGKALNLLDRLSLHEEEVMAFLIYGAPFDNNEAERDLRMMKTRQKISGCFRSLECANTFATVRSVIATAKKRSKDVYTVLQKMLLDPADAEEYLLGT